MNLQLGLNDFYEQAEEADLDIKCDAIVQNTEPSPLGGFTKIILIYGYEGAYVPAINKKD